MSDQGAMVGRTFNGRYEIKDRIGIGGMAEVYRAQDNVLGRVVAVKVMLPQFAADPAFTQRFRLEAAAAANLQSPYIVNVYDWGHDDDTYFIVMEFVRGSDLKTAIQQRGAINQRKVAEIGAQVCQALAVAHKQDVIHRDIKPQNIMVQPDGNVKVMDFGIARAKNSLSDKTQAVLGTAHYISPEQAQGKDLAAASDIYSLGVVLYEAATGKLPFDAPDAVSVAMMQVQEEPLMPSEIKPDIDPVLEDIIMVALAKDPRDRFATANDMRMALNDYLAGRPVTLPSGALAGDFSSANTHVMNNVNSDAATHVMNPVNNNGVAGTVTMPVIKNGGGAQTPDVTGNFGGGTTFSVDDAAPKNKRGLIIGIVIAVLLIAAGIGVFAFGGMGGSGNDVPEVTGMTQEQATKEIEKAGFEVGVVSGKYDPTVPEGQVISQNPAGGSKAPEGSKIDIIISQGTEEITLPDFKDKTEEDAQKEAADLGIKLVKSESVYSDDVKKDRIVSTDPKPGTKVAPGSTVEYQLSRGPKTTQVPNVIGKTQEEAVKELQDAGFQVSVKEDYDASMEKGRVVRQNPLNDPAEAGSTVTITVSLGSQMAAVPDVVNYSEGNATAKLEGAGFSVSINREYSNSVDEGYVISQSNTGEAELGSSVTITISRGPAPAPEPTPEPEPDEDDSAVAEG